MVVGGPIFFFQQDPSEYARRSRKSLALVEQLEGDKEESARADVKELVQEETPPGLENLQLESREQTLYNKDLVGAPLPSYCYVTSAGGICHGYHSRFRKFVSNFTNFTD